MNSRVALITFLDGGSGNYPDQSLPVPPGPVDPGYGRPGYGGGHPSHPIYRPPNYPSTGPVFPPVGPDNTLPDTGNPPTISLPIVLPPPTTKPIEPEQLFELKYSVRYGWVLVPVNDETAEPK